MTDWWETIRWGGTSVIALGALTLGVRAEMRAARYKPTLVIAREGDGFVTIVNTTGEAISDVSVISTDGPAVFNSPLMENEERKTFPVEGFIYGQQVTASWTRPLNGNRYQQLGPAPSEMDIRPLRRAFAAYRDSQMLKTSKGRRSRY